MITQVVMDSERRSKEDDIQFEEKDIREVELPKKGSGVKRKFHEDQITWIEVMVNQRGFATASFDCQVHLWSIETFEKIGSLILGHDTLNNNWSFNVNVEERR